jgi:putative tryptophan/tyrosine transport system substrate-binding protein
MTQPTRRRFLRNSAAALLAASLPISARAQAQPIVAILLRGSRQDYAFLIDGFLQGMREQGYEPGRNVKLVEYSADGDVRKLHRIAGDVVRLNPAVVFAPGPWDVHALRSAGAKMPIVHSVLNDPVLLKFAQSFNRPGGNITGVSTSSQELTGKRLELLRELFPRAKRVAVIYDKEEARGCNVELVEVEKLGKQLGLEILEFGFDERRDLPGLFDRISRAKVDVAMIPTVMPSYGFGGDIIALAKEQRIPVIYESGTLAQAGGVLSYGPDWVWASRRAAYYVARILKGANPAELPIERPTTYQLVVNAKALRELGVTVPPSVLVRADRVIE